MEATKYCSLGQITQAMYEVGGSIVGICRESERIELEIEEEETAVSLPSLPLKKGTAFIITHPGQVKTHSFRNHGSPDVC